ncbi:MAG TPA: TetR/AcrR family transcriptional regulator [Chloroflexota bacterium]|nr:TetR/AcrR family transcriptional regulator [Chloroflexota bacterium]
MSAAERREEILEAAVAEFAVMGLHGTSTERIAQRVGVSQPYLFRLFGTKKDLFLAAVNRGFDRVETVFRVAAEAHPERPLEAMGEGYGSLLTRREELLLQMQAYAACADPDVQSLVQHRYGQLYRLVEHLSGADSDTLRLFFAQGMLMNVAASIYLPSLLGEDWARNCFGVDA